MLGAITWLLATGGAVDTLAEEGAVIWEFASGADVFGSPAADGSGNVYFGSRDGKVYSLNAEGAQRWAFQAGDWVDSSPTLSGDESTVYFGSWDNRLYAVSSADGGLLWSFETGSLIVASPAVDADGNLFFGSADGFFYSLSESGELRWSFLVGADLDSSPAVAHDGSVYVGAYDGLLYAFDNEGGLKWTFATESTEVAADQRIKAPPTVDPEGNVYFGAGDGRVYAVDSLGVERWRFAAREKVDTGIAFGANGSLLFASRDGFLYCVDELGVLRWESYVGDVFYSTPAVDEFGRVYVGSYLGNGVSGITALSLEGELLWESLTLDYIDSSPLLDGMGALYFGCYDGNLYAVEAMAAMGESAWSRFGGDGSNRSRQKPLADPLVVQPEYAAWLQSYGLFGDAAVNHADPDGDGWGVLLEYLLRGSPVAPDRSLVEFEGGGGEGGTLAIQFARPKQETGFWLVVESSQNLENWLPAEQSESPITETVIEADVSGNGSHERVRVEADAATTLFLRLAAYPK